MATWGPFHIWFRSSLSTSHKKSCDYYLMNNYPIRSQFCTCHDSWAVVTCANLWPDWVIRIQFESKQIFMKFQLWAHGPFVRCFLVPVLRPSWAIVWVLYQWMSGICAHIGELVHKTASVSVSGTYGPKQAASGYDGLTLSQNQASACRWGTGSQNQAVSAKTRQFQDMMEPAPGPDQAVLVNEKLVPKPVSGYDGRCPNAN